MIATAHLCVGAAIGIIAQQTKRNNYMALTKAVLEGIISHAVLDRIPHEDYLLFYDLVDGAVTGIPLLCTVTVEFVLTSIIVWKLFFANTVHSSNKTPYLVFIGAGIFGSALPDIQVLCKFANNVPCPKLFELAKIFHRYCHGPHEISLFGLFTEVSIVMMALCLIWHLRETP